MRSTEQWRRLVKVSGAAGLILIVLGYAALHQPTQAYRTPALLAFYGGFALLIASFVCWYRFVPPKPPAPEEPEASEEVEEHL
jgi:hypothetical protein